MSVNIQEAQRNAVVRMLSLSVSSDEDRRTTMWGEGSTWKVLVFDKTCQDILAPLVKVGSLRQHGVTLYLHVDSERTPVPEVPAVYFLAPTDSNVERIIQDVGRGLYANFHLNFASSIPRPLLEKLAKGVVQVNAVPRISRVVDRYLDFVSLSPTEYSFNSPRGFEIIHGNRADAEIEAFLDHTTEGLFSVLATLGVVPVIRCPSHSSSPAQMVARKLETRLRDCLALRSGAISQLFGTSGSAIGTTRPALLLLDRELDLNVMLHHTWTYQALVHDVLGLRLNRVVVTEDEGKDGGVGVKKKTYDLDSSDQLWSRYSSAPFPELAVAVSDALTEYNAKMQELGQQKRDERRDEGDAATGLTSAINALPEMAEKKRSIDVHTNIASALVNSIRDRSLDKYYELEDEMESSVTNAIPNLEALLKSPDKGTLADKTRALMCLYLVKPNLPSTQLGLLKGALRNVGGDTRALDFLQKLESYKSLQADTLSASAPLLGGTHGSTAATSGLASVAGAQAAAWGSRVLDKSSRLLQGVKSLLPLKRDLPIGKVCSALLEQRPSSLTDSFLYIDPKAAPVGGAEVPRIKTPFKHAIVFVVGGGNFVEAQALRELASRAQKQILYGSTDFAAPEEFLEELTILGGGGPANGVTH